jgi:hypothetical protein
MELVMSSVPDFGDDEIKVVEDTLQERYRRPVPVQRADVELRLTPEDRELTECPALYWEDGECHFVIAKLGKARYHCQFYYGLHQQYGTGRPEYDDLFDCVTTLLKLQADHAATEQEQA